MYDRLPLIFLVLWCLPLSADIEVTPEAKHLGNSGLRVTVQQTNDQLLRNDQVANLQQLRCRFYLRLDRLNASEGARFTLLSSTSTADHKAFALTLVYSQERWQLNLEAAENDGELVQLGNLEMIVLPNQGWFAVELEWLANDSSGGLSLWLDDIPQDGVSNLQNGNLMLAQLHLGIAEMSGAIQGFYDFDDFEVRMSGQIGTTCFPRAALLGPATQWPASHDVRFVVDLANASCP